MLIAKPVGEYLTEVFPGEFTLEKRKNKMRNYYTIKRNEWFSEHGFLETTLAKDNKFYLATNEPLKFHSAMAASKYWRETDDIPACGSDIHIRGPRNGYHSICCYHPHR